MTLNMNCRFTVMRSGALLLALLTGACATGSQPAPTLAPEAAMLSQPKQLATVMMSPTPNEAEQQATRLAASPTPNEAATTAPTPTATVYVGFFLGDSAQGIPVVDGEQIEGAPPTITPVFSRCPIPPETEILGEGWQANIEVQRGLGCAIEGFVPFSGSQQVFENGVMYFRPTGEIWAIATGDPGQYWQLDQAPTVEPPTDIEPPPGLLIPEMGFGSVWRGVRGVRGALGYALFPESNAELGFQRFEGGILFYDGESGQVFALMLDNTAYGPYQGAG